MKLKVFSIYDMKAETFTLPMFQHNDKIAMRHFGDAVNDQSTMFNKHPEDYALYELGEYDDDTGQFKNYDKHKSLGLAAEYIIPDKGE